MIEKKDCIACGFEIVVINCHYTCRNCGLSENCHDMPHMIDSELVLKYNKENNGI